MRRGEGRLNFPRPPHLNIDTLKYETHPLKVLPHAIELSIVKASSQDSCGRFCKFQLDREEAFDVHATNVLAPPARSFNTTDSQRWETLFVLRLPELPQQL